MDRLAWLFMGAALVTVGSICVLHVVLEHPGPFVAAGLATALVALGVHIIRTPARH